MGADANHRATTAAAWLIAAVISALNLLLIYLTVAGE
jgi:manganese transport protein